MNDSHKEALGLRVVSIFTSVYPVHKRKVEVAIPGFFSSHRNTTLLILMN